jgi:hypothetical protein
MQRPVRTVDLERPLELRLPFVIASLRLCIEFGLPAPTKSANAHPRQRSLASRSISTKFRKYEIPKMNQNMLANPANAADSHASN